MKPRRLVPLDMQRAEDEEGEYKGVDTRNSGGNVMSPGKNKVFFLALPASGYFGEIEIDVHGCI